MITRSADASRKPLLAWLASALVVTMIETWRALPEGSWSASYLLLLFAVTAAISAAWTVVLVPPAIGLARLGRWIAAREPQPLLWIGPALAGCLLAGRAMHKWEAKAFVRHDLAAGFTPMIELVGYGAIITAAMVLHRLTRRWTMRIPRRVVFGAAAVLAVVAALVPALRVPQVFAHSMVPVAALALVALAVATFVQIAPQRWIDRLRWRPGRRSLAIAAGVQLALLLFAAYGGRIAPRTYPAALAAIRERQLVVPKVMTALTKLADRDGDGFSPLFGGIDCDDGNRKIHPFAQDVAGDGVDQDCFDGDLSKAAVEADAAARAEAGARTPRARAQNVIMVTIDAARADAFGFAGGPPTPAIDGLAARGVVFTRAYTQAPMTRTAFPSLMAGRPPSEIRWLDQQTSYPYPISEDVNLFVAEVAAAGGIATGFAVPFKYPVNAHFDQGFTDKAIHPASKSKNDINADKVVDDAIKLVEGYVQGGKRFFVWVHFYEAHHPYVKHKGFERGKTDHEKYLSEIAWIDSQIARLLAKVETLGVTGSTAVLFTGDHGEEFGEHGGEFHGDLHIEDLAVPLIVIQPGIAPAVIDTPTSLIDVAPTITELLGLAIPDRFHGISLVPWLEGEPPPADRSVYAEILPDRKVPRRLLTVIDGRWQLIADFELGGRELYDLSRDPFGQHNRIADEPSVARDLETRLRRHMALRMGPVRVTRAKTGPKNVEPIEED